MNNMEAKSDSSVFVTEPLKRDLATILQIAWRRYTELFGESPHGTLKQMNALVVLMKLDAFVDGIANHAVAISSKSTRHGDDE